MKTINRTSHALSEMADFAKTLGHSHRLTLVEAIFRHESSVEHLAEISGLSITNTSQHLQQLRRAGFVQTRREGKHVLYRIGDGPVANILAALRDYLAYQQTEIQRVVSDSIHQPEHLEGVSIEELLRRQEEGVLLLDVRSEEDYAAGHIPGAINIPTEALVHHLEELPRNQDILAYCGGRYCVLSIQAVSLLRSKGFKALRLGDGFPGWRAAGLRVEVSPIG
ncbi:ArsR/SmtB family transcription factor [Xenorhabdus bovienii]|uniref:ArsR/SmtB family transcription factor n=1 Tax=Xenorhabdus bovienii TaxID=40576 RepID=UPI0023B3358D|nr:metalloregulator ArsR/SmtB family transcription factor [Xenorhabdus bovienii]MDE9432892.1 metalloregulator ArsR/SmtB family transcription factor [Xenorhabdus bovienii]MDE9490668.1 metalloregulator ArsR/SmtB family transcription factor [Xenorhabdus bovienii]MDE9506812.1 metalloregulator ArsR/SmtB family transcription factor [Xenorhabdus bovienii]MDE9547616.1 metalloregulator ArsR/SmtB family transcription factor [Xenorhabdus bovienii]